MSKAKPLLHTKWRNNKEIFREKETAVLPIEQLRKRQQTTPFKFEDCIFNFPKCRSPRQISGVKGSLSLLSRKHVRIDGISISSMAKWTLSPQFVVPSRRHFKRYIQMSLARVWGLGKAISVSDYDGHSQPEHFVSKATLRLSQSEHTEQWTWTQWQTLAIAQSPNAKGVSA